MIHRIPPLKPNQRARCTRCETTITTPTGAAQRASQTAAAAIAALILFWPAILLPILTVERLGQSNQQSILSGIVELINHGSYFVATVVFVFSILFPLGKLLLLIELSYLQLLHRRHKAATLRMIEHLGKWSMMDVMLLAFLVMLVKLGNLVHFEFGPAVVAFVLCVAMSMFASLSFDPHAIWEDEQ